MMLVGDVGSSGWGDNMPISLNDLGLAPYDNGVNPECWTGALHS